MAEPPIVINKKISNAKKALLVFNEIDFERIRSLGLDSKVIFYLGQGLKGNRITRRYEGSIYTEPDNTGGITNYPIEGINLPKPSDFDTIKTKQFFGVSLKAELDNAGNLEFIIHASDEDSYMGLDALRKVIIPEFFKKGYDQSNINHTSIFYLHLGNHRRWFDGAILSISSYGLHINKNKEEGIKIFTQQDLAKFRNLSP